MPQKLINFFLFQDVLNLFSGNEEFIILGHSFGSMLSIELASLLEKAGKKGSLMIVDGSPKFIQKMSSLLVPNRSDDNIRNVLLVTCIRVLFSDEFNDIAKKVFSFSAWDDQLKCFGEYSVQRSRYSYEYGKIMLNALVKRMNISLDADKLQLSTLEKTPLRFLKASESSAKDLEEDYGLSQYSKQPIITNIITGNHVTMLSNPEIVKLINNEV
jgi:fatty acid synthase, animal type